MTDIKYLQAEDVGFDELLITDIEWLERNGFHKLIPTGKFDEKENYSFLSLNGMELDFEEKLIIPFISDEIGDLGVEAVVNFIKVENIFKIWTDIHDNYYEKDVVYAKRISE